MTDEGRSSAGERDATWASLFERAAGREVDVDDVRATVRRLREGGDD